MATKRRTPRQILADIANDEKASAASRIRAANSLLADAERRRNAKLLRAAEKIAKDQVEDTENNLVNKRAAELAAARENRRLN